MADITFYTNPRSRGRIVHWLLEERFSAGDVSVGSQIQRGLMAKGLDPRPAFDRYMQQIAARPALQPLMKGAQSS
jgi:glutathione S-transferase